jgi:hypothetical protein
MKQTRCLIGLSARCSKSAARFSLDDGGDEAGHAREAARIALRPHDPSTGEEVEKEEVVKGYEYQRGQFVTFSAEELKALDVESSRIIDLGKFVPRGELPLFRTIGRGAGTLMRTVLPCANGHAMIRRRAIAAGIGTELSNHSFRATGITAYLKNGGTLEKAAAMANYASTRTTQLYDRRRDELSLDEVERIVI